MKRTLPFLFVFLMGLVAFPANAEVVSGLYEAQVPLPNKGEAARRQGVIEAFRTVLVKVSGYSGVLDDPAVAEAIGQAERYVQQFRYREGPTAGAPPGLWVRFNGPGVEQMLRSQNLPVWGSLRPVMMVWLAVEDNGLRELVGTGSNYARTLQANALARGVPLRLPLLDLTDRSNITASDVWGDFRSTIMDASRRYDAQVVLTGRLNKGRSGGYRVRWALYGQGEPVFWEDWGPDVSKILASGIGAGVDSVSLRYAQNGAGESESAISLRVEDVFNSGDLSRALRYLESVNGINRVEVTGVGAGYASFRLELSGSPGIARQALALGDVLDEVEFAGGVEPSSAGTELVYRLLK